jgi:hypothetical protein
VLASFSGWAIKAIDAGITGRPLHYPVVAAG